MAERMHELGRGVARNQYIARFSEDLNSLDGHEKRYWENGYSSGAGADAAFKSHMGDYASAPGRNTHIRTRLN